MLCRRDVLSLLGFDDEAVEVWTNLDDSHECSKARSGSDEKRVLHRL